MKENPFDPVKGAAEILSIENAWKVLAKTTKQLYDAYVSAGFTEKQAREMAQNQLELMRREVTGK